jgi:N-acyl-D-amino-acid deacylase
VGRFGGIYASHIRERGDDFEGAVNEALDIGLRGELRVQLSHLAPRPYAPSKILDKILTNIHKAAFDGQSVGIDTFPDPWGPAHLLDLVPSWVYEGSDDEVLGRLKDPSTAEKCYEYIQNKGNFLLRLSGFDQFYLSYSRSYPEFISMSLDEISKTWDIDIVQTILNLAVADGKDFGSVLIRHIFSEDDDLDQLLKDPLCSVGSDGAVASKEGLLKELKMNRSSFGYAPRTIEEYAMKRGLFSVEEAVRKMTSLPASQVNVSDRGTIQVGKAADVVVMDLEVLADLSTDDEPQEYPAGIDTVVVNGEIVFEGGEHTLRRPGTVLAS